MILFTCPTGNVQSVRSRVGNICDYLKADMSLSDFRQFLKSELVGEGALVGSLPEHALKEIEDLRSSKYESWEWVYGRSPQFTLHNKLRFAGGSIEVYLTTSHAVIQEISFYGDYLSMCPMTDLQHALAGCLFRREDVRNVLLRFPLSDYFGSITLDEILDVIFHATKP